MTGLVALAVHQPVVLAIEDIHWIDQASLRVLQFVVRRFERELDRIGFRSTSVDELTSKTIDGALTRVYAKLDIHSRAELGSRMARGPVPHTEG